MNKNQVSGRVDQVAGKAKEVTGKAVGNQKLETEGKAQKNLGKVEAGFGDAREKAKDTAKDAIDKL